MVYWLVILLLTAWAYVPRFFPYAGMPGVPLLEKPFFAVLLGAAANLAGRSWAKGRVTQGRMARAMYVRLGWLFVSTDLLLIALGLRFTGGANSPLWIVVFVVVVAETILASKDETTWIRLGATVALVTGTIPPPPAGDAAPTSYLAWLVTSGYALDLGTRLAFIIAVSSVTRHLRETAAATDRENAALRAEISLADERTKLSREIHDGVGNSLAAAVLRLEVAARTLEKQEQQPTPPSPGMAAETVALLRDEAKALREAMTAVRDWTFFNRPWPAAEQPSSGAGKDEAHVSESEITADRRAVGQASHVLAAETDRLARRTGMPIQLEGAQVLDALSAPVRLAVLRITQEALTNAAKYAVGATGATVSIRHDPPHDTMLLLITDDGCGFDPEAAGAGLGLTSMRERAEAMGGVLRVESGVGRGTRVTAEIPCR